MCTLLECAGGCQQAGNAKARAAEARQGRALSYSVWARASSMCRKHGSDTLLLALVPKRLCVPGRKAAAWPRQCGRWCRLWVLPVVSGGGAPCLEGSPELSLRVSAGPELSPFLQPVGFKYTSALVIWRWPKMA